MRHFLKGLILVILSPLIAFLILIYLLFKYTYLIGGGTKRVNKFELWALKKLNYL